MPHRRASAAHRRRTPPAHLPVARAAPARLWRLLSTAVASLLVHAVSFYFCRWPTRRPARSCRRPSRRSCTARRPDDPAEVRASPALARWLTVNDPALTTQPGDPRARPCWRSLLPLRSFLQGRAPAVQTAGPAVRRDRAAAPASSARGRCPCVSAAAWRQPGSHPVAADPRLVLPGRIAPLAPAPLPASRSLCPPGRNRWSQTVFLVGVRPGGGEPFLFREASSGESGGAG